MNFIREERDAYLLGLMRMLFGVLLCVQVWARFHELENWGYFGSFFHLPFVPESWVPSVVTYRVLLWLELTGAALGVLGWFGREGLLLGSSIGLFMMLCDRLQYHNNRFSLLLFCFLCALCPSDRSFLLYRGKQHALPVASRIAPTFPRRLIQLQVSLLYLSSGGSKALDADWRGGQTMLLRFQRGFEEATQAGATPPALVVDLLTSPLVNSIASKLAISLELGLAVALCFGRTRVAALWAGAIFHLLIQASAQVELFSFVMGVAYIAFVTPEVRERTLFVDSKTPLGRTLKGLVPWFDWFARFRIEVVDAKAMPVAAERVAVVGREGERAHGSAVSAALARALPAWFVAWPLFALIARARHSAIRRTTDIGSSAGPG